MPARPTDPLVHAATELRCFGGAWCALGGATAALGLALAAARGVEAADVAAFALVLGLSLFAALAGLLLAKRTGPAILYRRIFDRAPELPSRVPRELPRETLRRTLWPAAGAWASMLAAAPVAVALTLVLLAVPRDEVLERLVAPSVTLGGAWTLASGAAALRIAHYFRRWERAKGRLVVCRARRAGLMGHVYAVVEP